METKEIILNEEELKDLPLFFRKIYYNQITDSKEEAKLMRYNFLMQCNLMRDSFPQRQISKTINYKIFKPTTHDK